MNASLFSVRTALRLALVAAVLWPIASHAEPLVEPRLTLPPSTEPRVALTLDACGGTTDMRILNVLISERIPATIFVTGKWLKRNAAALDLIRQHPDLFELENHGLNHVAAVDRPRLIFGQKSAGSAAGVVAEVDGGSAAMKAAGLAAARWYRGATAEYTLSAMALIENGGARIAGFSLNADQGASLGAKSVEKRIAAARDGDVIVAHINQPKRPAGDGVVAGIRALKARNVRFVRLGDVSFSR